MASIRKKHTDAVIVGFGWTGAIMAIELANAGLDVVALERGDNRDTIPDFAYPQITDEVKYSARQALLQNLAKTTVTIRHTKGDVALPYRQFGTFKPGEGVGGASLPQVRQTVRTTVSPSCSTCCSPVSGQGQATPSRIAIRYRIFPIAACSEIR